MLAMLDRQDVEPAGDPAQGLGKPGVRRCKWSAMEVGLSD